MSQGDRGKLLASIEYLERALKVSTFPGASKPKGEVCAKMLATARDLSSCGDAEIEARAKKVIKSLKPWWKFW